MLKQPSRGRSEHRRRQDQAVGDHDEGIEIASARSVSHASEVLKFAG